MTLGELFQRAKERVSELNLAIDTLPEYSRERAEAEGRYEEAKVFLDLIAEVVSARASGEAIISLTPEEYAEMRTEIHEYRAIKPTLDRMRDTARLIAEDEQVDPFASL